MTLVLLFLIPSEIKIKTAHHLKGINIVKYTLNDKGLFLPATEKSNWNLFQAKLHRSTFSKGIQSGLLTTMYAKSGYLQNFFVWIRVFEMRITVTSDFTLLCTGWILLV